MNIQSSLLKLISREKKEELRSLFTSVQLFLAHKKQSPFSLSLSQSFTPKNQVRLNHLTQRQPKLSFSDHIP